MFVKKSAMNSRKIFIITLLFINLFLCLLPTNSVSGDYAISVGDSFDYKITALRNNEGQKIAFYLGSMVFTEGDIMRITFTTVEVTVSIPDIEYEVRIGDDYMELSLFSDILVQNRNWADLTDEYESYGYYTVSDNNGLWGVTHFLNGVDINGGGIEVNYLKTDGVINKFHAYDYPELESQTTIDHLAIIRQNFTPTTNNASLVTSIGVFSFVIIAIGSIYVSKRTKRSKAHN